MVKINWQPNISLDSINYGRVNTLVEHLDIMITEITEDYLKATMPVNSKVHQPYGILHGGASCVLSETLGSIASACTLDITKQYPVGIEISASHLRPVKSGLVTGICKAIKLGKRLHLWETRIYDESDNLICTSKLTVMILNVKNDR